MTNKTQPFSAAALSQMLGQAYAPTPEQAAVIEHPLSPLLVVAGAGAGKTETMAARVVYLVATGQVLPEQVLGLTFTRKAAAELSLRIRTRLQELAQPACLAQVCPRPQEQEELARRLAIINPTIMTYDAYAAKITKEYGLLYPVEPGARLLNNTEYIQVVLEVLGDPAQEKILTYLGKEPLQVARALRKLNSVMDGHLVSLDEARATNELWRKDLLDLVAKVKVTKSTSRVRPKIDYPEPQTTEFAAPEALRAAMSVVNERAFYLDLLEKVEAELARRQYVTFGRQMRIAAELAQKYPQVAAGERARYTAVMLDEYQDTSHNQRVLLSSLFSRPYGSSAAPCGVAVTAVGDPMQAIYGWRGATAANLLRVTKDFLQQDGTPAAVKQLSTSWRNPEQVLTGANAVAQTLLQKGGAAPDLVAQLQPGPAAGAGQVAVQLYDSGEQELAAIGDYLATYYEKLQQENAVRQQNGQPEKPLSAAILVRKKKYQRALSEELTSRGIPNEVVGLSGLLLQPEVLDLLAILRLLVQPEHNQAALRLLCSPYVNLGLQDLQALKTVAGRLAEHERPEGLTRKDFAAREGEPPVAQMTADPELKAQLAAACSQQPAIANFVWQLVELQTTVGDAPVGLGDALYRLPAAQLWEQEPFYGTRKGWLRLNELRKCLLHLQQAATLRSLSELVLEAITMFGLRTELLTRGGLGATRNLDRFVETVVNYQGTLGASLPGLLDYLEMAETEDLGFDADAAPTSSERVLIMTAHAAKGLEWDVVLVPFATTASYADLDAVKRSDGSFLTKAELLPSELRGDIPEPDDAPGLPEFFFAAVAELAEAGVVNDKDKYVDANFKTFKSDFGKALVQREAAEAARLFYVAITRARQELVVSAAKTEPVMVQAASQWGISAQAEKEALTPSPWLELVGNTAAAAGIVDQRTDSAAAEGLEAEGPAWVVPEQLATSVFPRDLSWYQEKIASGVSLVDDAVAQLPPPPQASDEQCFLWEQETSALIAEAQAAALPTVTVDLGRRISASERVALAEDLQAFGRRKARPIPFKPNEYAKRGTAFHQFLEDRWSGAQDPLAGLEAWDPDDNSSLDSEKLKQLKENFAASMFATMTPVYVEKPYEIRIGPVLEKGRMDAVFRVDENTWWVIDWKTGRMPKGQALKKKELQLASYRLALHAQLQAAGKNVALAQINAGFFYVAENTMHWAEDLPSLAELARMVAQDAEVLQVNEETS